MELLSSLLGLWWVVPAAAAVGAGGWLGVRASRAVSARRIAVAAARRDLSQAKQDARARRATAIAARAELSRLRRERAEPGRLGQAQQVVRDATQAERAGAALVRSRRAQLGVARVERRLDTVPRERLEREHDQLLSRWLEYQTDPGRALDAPAMSDGRVPETARLVEAIRHAASVRPRAGSRLTVGEFAAYRDAVAELRLAFDAAEGAAQGRRAEVPVWQDAAADLAERAGDALERTVDALRDWHDRWRQRP